jgi:hypothetical protein
MASKDSGLCGISTGSGYISSGRRFRWMWLWFGLRLVFRFAGFSAPRIGWCGFEGVGDNGEGITAGFSTRLDML